MGFFFLGRTVLKEIKTLMKSYLTISYQVKQLLKRVSFCVEVASIVMNRMSLN